ncbi:MAG TPA: carboxy terminal-processing peptidase [Bacteroidales bacterium]|nr:carboxy terminal-processing peptidase [Bacteroidales bacterium]MDI9573356.1 carboxy terminal-processing peptidase [Bacteroidota bacterium]OQC59836.1 MAG: Tail-specific protease precursor [Bacteroidetes bacterium ADurb.Bin012]MBP9588347.1 carboxy terminal-processing peptidase [Bacteroidales bacterium]HNQ59885.1 carboxy terminal-processing peptidase [Bacteroidales bacterium]
MKYCKPVLLFVLFILILPGCGAQVDEQKRNLILMDLLKRSVEEGHFSPVAMDDQYSKKAYNLFIEQLDPLKRFFTEDDLAEMKKYELRLDDEFKNYDTEFFELTYNILSKRLKQIEDFYSEILKRPFDFGKEEYLEMDPDKRRYPKNDEELKTAWEQMLKYEVLNWLTDKIGQQEKAIARADTSFTLKTIDQLEKEAREKINKRYADWFHEMNKLEKADRFADYLNCLVSVFDPHTNYFPPKEKEDFDIQFSGQLEGIGATLQSKDGYVTVVSIVPGGPAWKQGELEVNDKIIKVAQEGSEPVDITDWRVDKAVQLIRGKKGTLVRLTVRKLNGVEKEIAIQRDVVIIEETYAKSAVVEDTLTRGKVGYIFLPSFYANFEDPNGRSSSRDMLQEVEKLKNAGVQGIIIDLRGNGGGSLQDAIEIAGLFIDQGPVVQVKGRVGNPRVYGDPQPGIVYEGPLIIMVNPISASASEILAAALQDYHRAIITGTSKTFGKGTVQRFFNLDDLARGFDEVKPLGSLKLTIQKFYRIDGGSTQLKGVSPDIIMSDPYTYLEIGESELKYPMEWTQVNPANYSPFNNEYLFTSLEKKSTERIKNDERFQLLDEHARQIKVRRDKTLIPLKMDDFKRQNDENLEQSKAFDKLMKDTLSLKSTPLSVDLQRIGSDTTKLNILKKWTQSLRTDPYLLESVRIVRDWNAAIVQKR